ncbi:MAG: molybdopterin-dependent oxidoreductase [Planctomycetota bacterium]
MNSPHRIQVKTACNRDCPDACGIVATLEGNRIVQIQGDKEHPITRGFLCKRTSRFLDRQYDPGRITKPLIRVGSKDEDNWREASLEEALDLVAEKLLHFRDNVGPASIMNYRCGGSMGMMKYVTDYFFQEFGPVTIKSGDICSGAGDIAQETDFGHVDSSDIFGLYDARTIFLWGKNVYVSHVHLLPVLKECRAKGARIVLIDPVRHRTVDICDDYIQNVPGSDGAIAFGIARLMNDRNQLDAEAATYCDHFDEFVSLILSRTADEWAQVAGLTFEQLNLLAEAYANGPTTVLCGWGMQRRRNGANTIRAIDALAAVSGNIGVAGGGVSYYFARRGAFDVSFKDDSTAPRTIPEPLLGQGIEEAADPPVEMVFVSAANPVTNVPESQTVARALRDRFTVVIDYVMTDTARCADVILPTVTMLEDDDLIGAYGHHWINEVRPVVDAPEDALTDYQIMQRLAGRVGLEEKFSGDADWWKRRMMAGLQSHGVTLESLREKSTRNPLAAKVLFEDRKFPTESGKINLVTEFIAPETKTVDDFPLRLMALSTDEAQAAQWQPEQQEGPATLTVHPDAAADFADGDVVVVGSNIGQMSVRLKFDPTQRTDIALMDKGGWLSNGRCANALTRGELSDEGECAVYYETPVRLSRAGSPG